jgi:NTP pyrophosphatase (non-canonical NTP hydrolase)
MNFNAYQERAQRFGAPLDNDDEQIKRAILGLCGETGELAELFKKEFYQGHARADRYKLISEIGDILWYVQDLCEALGERLGFVAAFNLAKLATRYPEGHFRQEDSVGRMDERD